MLSPICCCMLLVLVSTAAATPDARTPHGLQTAIARLVAFFIANPAARTPDALLGIQIGQLQLADIISQRGVDDDDDDTRWLRALHADVTAVLRSHDRRASVGDRDADAGVYNEFRSDVHRGLRNPSLWLAATCSRRRRGRRGRLALPTGPAATGDYGADHGRDWERVRNAYARLFDIIDVGGPTANDSDECLAELFAAAQSVHAGAAAVSTKCLRDVMSVDAEAHGYHLTHKLLYYMVLRGVKQTGRLPMDSSAELNIMRLCRYIWDEARIVESVGFPPDMRDLFIEQVFLCGKNGFGEFLQLKWIQHIIGWQQPQTGCFVYASFSNATDPMFWRHRPRFRRSVQHLTNNCSDHMSGLAVATLIQFLKNAYY